MAIINKKHFLERRKIMKFVMIKKKSITRLFIALFSIFIFTLNLFTFNHLCIIPNVLSTSASNENTFQQKVFNLMNQKEKIAYLTFDDGPTLKSTPRVLDILSEENVKATFFVIGKHVKEHPEIVKRAYDEGHYIANHGYSHHNDKLYASADSFINEILSTDVEIARAIGIENYSSHVFRFPNGYMASSYKTKKQEYAKLLSDIDYTYIDWNALNKDSEKKYSNAGLLNNLKESSKNKGTLVILMHDTSDVNETHLVLKDSIQYLKEQGYIFQNFYDLK